MLYLLTKVGAQHDADVSDVVLESAVMMIVDLEDSVATVDGEDKALAYRTWLGLMTGDLTSELSKGGETVTRRSTRTASTPPSGRAQRRGKIVTVGPDAAGSLADAGPHLRTPTPPNAVLTADGQENQRGRARRAAWPRRRRAR